MGGSSKRLSKNILSTLWEKMIIVGAFGTIMTSFRMSFRELIDSYYGEDVLRGTMKEILTVGIAEGIELGSVSLDQIIIDLKKEAKVSPELFGGFSDYLVYDGWNLKGWPVKTIVRGTVVAEDFEVIGKPGYGNFIPRVLS